MRVSVRPYDPRWAADFENVKAALGEALRYVRVLSIEHVGSTSVPDLPAKPVIDIDIVVRRDDVSRTREALVAAGYGDEGDRGVPNRFSFAAPDHDPARHVYVCVDGCLALRNHRAVRDLLRADSGLRDEYGFTKLQLAEREFVSTDDYTVAKGAVLQKILQRAGLPEPELTAIAVLNSAR